MFVPVAQPAGLETWQGRTHLIATIAGREVLACTGERSGEALRLAEDMVDAGLACEDCRRLWSRIASG